MIKNYTPHQLVIVREDGSALNLDVDGPAPRLAVQRDALGYVDGIDIVRSTMGAPTGLPDAQDGVTLVVSALVAEHPSLAHRTDLAYPGAAIRDKDGRIIGASGLCAGPGLAAKLAK